MSFKLGSILVGLISVAYATTLVDTKLPGDGSYIHVNIGNPNSQNAEQHVHLSASSHQRHYSTSGYDCTHYREYNDIMNLRRDDPCRDIIKAIQVLEDMKQHHYQHGHQCMIKAIEIMANSSANYISQCHCSGSIFRHNYPYVQNDQNYNNICWKDSHFMKLYNMFYQSTDIQQHQTHIGCVTHNKLWVELNQLRHNYPTDCQMTLLNHVYTTYSATGTGHHWRNYCKCSGTVAKASATIPTTPTTPTTTTQQPTTKPTTLSSTRLTTTRQPTTTAEPKSATHPPTTAAQTSSVTPTTVKLPTSFNTCPKLSAIQDIAQHNAASNANASSCPSGGHRSPDAFVMNHCTVTHSSSWVQGLKVMDHCHRVPLYTPVATFYHGQYVPNGGTSGIFLGCLPHGFKLGEQPCNNDPTVIHVEEGGIFTGDPNVYYTIQ